MLGLPIVVKVEKQLMLGLPIAVVHLERSERSESLKGLTEYESGCPRSTAGSTVVALESAANCSIEPKDLVLVVHKDELVDLVAHKDEHEDLHHCDALHHTWLEVPKLKFSNKLSTKPK